MVSAEELSAAAKPHLRDSWTSAASARISVLSSILASSAASVAVSAQRGFLVLAERQINPPVDIGLPVDGLSRRRAGGMQRDGRLRACALGYLRIKRLKCFVMKDQHGL